jgi:prepilin-type N-terminal cleavage/methylation domain-containing protein
MKMKQKKKQQGFTLIELMAVFTILAMLATLAVPAVVGTIERARAGTNESNRAMLQRAIRQYFIEEGEWPDFTAAANTLTRGIPTVLVDEGYIQSVPAILGLDPALATTVWSMQFRNPTTTGWGPWTDWVHDSNLNRRARIRVLLPEGAPGHVTPTETAPPE